MIIQEKIDLRVTMVRTFINAVEQNVNLIVVVSDSTSTSKIAPFMEKYPERLINVGIAEQNLVGIATGLSLGGYIPITANAASFLVGRANEQIKNDVCYSNMNVKLVGLNAGVSYGALGSTHHAIDDISIMRGLGNIQILAPSDPVETSQIFKYALAYKGPVYIRLDSAKFPVLHDGEYQFEVGKVEVLNPGHDISIFAVGSVVHEAFEASKELSEKGIDAEVLNVSSIRPVDHKQIVQSINKTGKVLTVEEHSLHGGLGSMIAEIVADYGLGVKVKRLGITEGQFAKAGPRAEIRSFYKIDSRGIVETICKL